MNLCAFRAPIARRFGTALSLAMAAGATAQPCPPSFSDAFASGDVSGTVNAVTVFDDGTGPAVYIGGAFTQASGGPVNRLAKWDGKRWAPVGTGLSGAVNALAVHDEDGPGPIPPALYIGGAFTTAGGITVNRLARWNGTVFGQVANGANNTVNALLSAEENGAPTLYVAGSFTAVGPLNALTVSNIAKLSGGAWSRLDTGVNGTVNSLALFDDGGGPAVHAGGAFSTAAGIAAPGVAKWSGSIWSPVGAGVTGGDVKCLVVHDDGNGPALYATGTFTTAGVISANRIARWDGAVWSDLTSGLNAAGQSMVSYQGKLFVSGAFTTAGGLTTGRIASFDGAGWTAFADGLSTTANSMVVFDFGGGPELVAGGAFATAGGIAAASVARWNGTYWTDLGKGANAAITSLGQYRSAVAVGGDFTRIGSVLANRVAAYDGSNFWALGDGFNLAPKVLVSFDPDGVGPLNERLIAGGNFTLTGRSAPMVRFASYDGTGWTQISTGANGQINSMVVFDDGAGPALYVAGNFTAIGGVNATRVARWNGSTITTVGAGMNNSVNQLIVYNNSLYAVGSFTASGATTTNRIARWDGAAWQPVDIGTNNAISAAAVFGGQLVVGGSFTSAGGVSANRVARWNGSAWSDAAGGADALVQAMSVFDNGTGAALYVGGDFTHVGAPAIAANRLARFDGTTWSAVGAGSAATVSNLATLRVDDATRLFIGGAFRALDVVSSDHIGMLGPCTAAPACYVNCDGSSVPPILNINDFICFQQRFAAADAWANCDGSTAPPVLNVNDFICFQQKYAAGCR